MGRGIILAPLPLTQNGTVFTKRIHNDSDVCANDVAVDINLTQTEIGRGKTIPRLFPFHFKI